MYKRIFDVIFSLIALLFLSPIMVILIFLVRLESQGPGIFRQKRIGLHEKTFTCFKLRTMKADTSDVPTHEASMSSITRIGGFLRRTKLDEIPQLWNILKGDMSFVGPRPCLPSQETLIEHRRMRGLFNVRPGITGLAQVMGVDMSDPILLANLDAEYLDNIALSEDIRIIINTLFGHGSGDRVRRS